MRAAALALLALTLAGCESTQEKSAKLEKAAKLQERSAAPAASGLTIKRASRLVKVLATAVVHSSEGTAAAVTLRNTSSHTLRDVPIEIHVRDARGASIYANDIPGLGAPLRSVALLAAHGELTWVDDQIQAPGTPASVVALVGEGTVATASPPRLALTGAHTVEDPANGPGAVGTLANPSAAVQREVVVYAVARKGTHIIGAGRAVLPEVPAHGSVPFQLYFIGQARGAKLELNAPATAVG
ncbi:MAG: hypothetical protein H0X28_06695 [Solirubrobacterales bacterium]|nr:hypothetical protein [Solirubrobacterales bacterium]